MHSLPPAALLDLDDTVLCFSGVSDEAWDDVCRVFAPRLDGVSAIRLRAAIRRAAREFWSDPECEGWGRLDLPGARRDVARRALIEVAADSEVLAAEIAETYGARRDLLVHPFPGAIDSLVRLRERGTRLALVTNGAAAPQREKIERFGLARHFDAILIEGELGFGKPDTRVFWRALEALSASPGDTWMVGNDLSADIAPAHALGMHTIWIDTTGAGLPPAAPVTPRRRVRMLAELVPSCD